MIFLAPFKNHSASGQAGNMLIITGLIASAVAVTGGKVMLDRSIAQRKANQMSQSLKQAKEIPGSAAMIAKALISLPPNVASDTAAAWTTSNIADSAKQCASKTTAGACDQVVGTGGARLCAWVPQDGKCNQNILPLVYPVPYVSGAIGSPLQPASRIGKTVNPPTGSNWDLYVMNGTGSATVKIFTNDSTRAKAQDVAGVLASQSIAGGSDAIKRTESRVTYVFRNCDGEKKTSTTFTGRYCVRAEIESDNYAGPVKGGSAKPSVNKAVAELGDIQPPPAPACGIIATPGGAVLKPGSTFDLDVNATGVAIGYQVIFGATTLKSESFVSLPWNNPSTSAVHAITGIPTTLIESSLKSLVASGVNQANFKVVLQGVTEEKHCDAVVTLPGPVSCVPNSFSVDRIGPDLRTCRVRLQKDNGEGSVNSIKITSQNTSTGSLPTSRVYSAPSFSGNTWTRDIDCNASPRIKGEDGFTFSANFSRTLSGVVSDSQCSPSPTIAELSANCVDSSLDGGRDPKDPNKCNITLKREASSHSVVTVGTSPAFLPTSALWNTVSSTDGTASWSGVISPCSSGQVDVSASLSRGSSPPDFCGKKTISGLEPAKCNGPPTGERNESKSDFCRLKVTKFLSSGPIKHVTIDGAVQAASTDYPNGGDWGASDSWTSPWFSCFLIATDYKMTLVGVAGLPSDCGTFKMPPVSYALTTSVTGNGSISKSPNSTTYVHGSTVNLTATPATGHKFVSWSDACSGTSDTCTVTMDSPKTVGANFTINTYTLVTSVTGSGTISRSTNATGYIHGSTVTLKATPAAGHKFESWGGACSGTAITCNVLMDSNKSVVANFAIIPTLVGKHMGTGLVKCPWRTEVRVNGGAWFSVGGNRHIGDLTVSISEAQGFVAAPFCNVMDVRAVSGAGTGCKNGTTITLPGGTCGSKGSISPPTGYKGNGTYRFANQDDICEGNTDINTQIYIPPDAIKYKVNGIAGQGSCP